MINDPSTVTLSAPLLASTEMPQIVDDDSDSLVIDWPVKLLIPQEYDPYQNHESPGLCYIRFDKLRNSFIIVSETTDTTLDIIDPNDVIGINVEITLLAQTFVDETIQNDEEERNVSPPTNEPSSEIPVDRQGTAVLTIYAYPKKDPSTESILNSCGLHRKPKPVTQYLTEEGNSSSTATKKSWHRHAHHRQFTVAPAEDFADLTTMVQAIRSIVKPSTMTTTPYEERLLVVINPVSGRKKALEIYQKTVVPIFEQASRFVRLHGHYTCTARGGKNETTNRIIGRIERPY